MVSSTKQAAGEALVLDDAKVAEKFIEAIKGVSSQDVIRAKDIERVQACRLAFEKMDADLGAKLRAGTITVQESQKVHFLQ